MKKIVSALKNLFRGEHVDRDLDDEVRGYAGMLEEEKMAQGMKREDAKRAAGIELGGAEQVKEEVRGARAGAFLETLWRDLRFAGRMLRKNPGFTAISVLTLALGIGANAGVFSVVNGVLLNPLPYPNPQQLVGMHESKPNFASGSISFPNFIDWRKNNRSFTDMALMRGNNANLTGMGEPERLNLTFVSSSFFSTLGVNPIAGRDLAEGEDKVGAAPVAILGDRLWQRKFGGSSDAIGRPITLDGKQYTIVGIVPSRLDLVSPNARSVEVYLPIGQWGNSWLMHRSAGLGFHGFARLKPGVTIEQARADMESVTNALALEYPNDNKGVGASMVPMREQLLGKIRPVLLLLLGAVAFVLLIACINVGNLMLARASGRTREVAIRSALGAGSWRLIRQLLTESVLLALVGAAFGLAIATWGTQAALKVLPTTLPRAAEVHLDLRVLLFTMGISVIAGILFGLAPALKIARTDLHETLKEGGRGSSGGKNRAQGVFVAMEMAMAIVLLAGAGLMIRSLSALWSVDPGFRADQVLTFGVSMPPAMSNAPIETIRTSLREVERKFSEVNAIKAVSLSWAAVPLSSDDEELFWLHGQPKPTSMGDMNWAIRYVVGPDYLKVMGTRLLRGRFFTERDDIHSPFVAVVDDVFAHQYFGNQDPIGKLIHLEGRDPEAEIIGVVEHVKQWGLDTDEKNQLRAELYRSMQQLGDDAIVQVPSGFGVLVRYEGSETNAFAALRQASSEMNGEQTIYGAQTMSDIVASTLAARQFSMVLLGAFAGIALLLAMIGVYGVISYSVGRRTNEIGLRMALGAPRSSVFRLVLGEGMKLAMIGAVIGVVSALALTRLISNLLFGVTAHDPVTFTAVFLALTAVAALACWIPAWRAMKVDPLVALRHE